MPLGTIHLHCLTDITWSLLLPEMFYKIIFFPFFPQEHKLGVAKSPLVKIPWERGSLLHLVIPKVYFKVAQPDCWPSVQLKTDP